MHFGDDVNTLQTRAEFDIAYLNAQGQADDRRQQLMWKWVAAGTATLAAYFIWKRLK